MTVKIDRKNTGSASPVVRADSKPSAAPSKRASTPVENAFTGVASQDAEKLSPKAKSVSVSASPEALWGRMQNDEDFAMNFFAAAAMRGGDKTEAVKAQMAEVQGQIGDRVEVLEGKWKHQRLDNRAQMLKHFAERSDLPSGDRAKIKALVSKQDALQAKITAASEQLKANYPPKTAAAAADRKEQLRALVELRKEQRALVYEAKAVVEKKPDQNVVLLAQNEQKLDPNAPKKQESLFSLLGKWLHLSSVLSFFTTFSVETTHKKAEESRDDTRAEIDRIMNAKRRRETEGLKQEDLQALKVGLKLS